MGGMPLVNTRVLGYAPCSHCICVVRGISPSLLSYILGAILLSFFRVYEENLHIPLLHILEALFLSYAVADYENFNYSSTAILIIIEGHETAFNGFQYQFTTRNR
jgi:hypothetical protein